MACKVESDYHYELCDQRIPHLQGCLGEVTLEKCCNVIMMYTTITILWPFGSGRGGEMSTLLKYTYLNRDIG